MNNNIKEILEDFLTYLADEGVEFNLGYHDHATDYINKKELKSDLIHNVIPSVGYKYYISERGKKIWGEVESHQGKTGKFWVKWDDGETTLESKCDAHSEHSV